MIDSARTHAHAERSISPRSLYAHISLKACGRTPVIVHDSSHSTRPVLRVTACPLTSVASKIEKRPCGDLSHSCSCWLRGFGRQSNSFRRWASAVQKKKKKKYLYSCGSCDVYSARTQSHRGLKVIISFTFLTRLLLRESETSIGRSLSVITPVARVMGKLCNKVNLSDDSVILFRYVTENNKKKAVQRCHRGILW